MIYRLQIWLLCILFLFGAASPLLAAERISVAVIRGQDATPLQESLVGFRDYFRDKSIELDFTVYTLQKGRMEAEDVIKKIRKDKPQVILALGSLPLSVVCPALEGEFNLTGVALKKADFECAGKTRGVYLEFPVSVQLAWMRKFLPGVRNIGVIYSSEENKTKVSEGSQLLKEKGMNILSREVEAPYEIPAALSDLSNRADVLWGISDRIVLTPGTARKMLLFSFRNKVPFVGLSKAWAKAGALYALDRDYKDIGRQCAEMVYRKFKGKPLKYLTPQPPRTVRYYLNLRAARHLKIRFSPLLVRDAQETY